MKDKKTWDDYPVTLSIKETAQLLGISRLNTITSKCRNGELPAVKMGKDWRIDRDQLRAIFASRVTAHGNLANQLGELELAISTLAAIHRGTRIEGHIRTAHRATLAAYTQAREYEE